MELPFFFCNMQDRYNHRRLCDKGFKKLGEFIPFSFYSSGPGNKSVLWNVLREKFGVAVSSSPSNISFRTSVFSKRPREKSPSIWSLQTCHLRISEEHRVYKLWEQNVDITCLSSPNGGKTMLTLFNQKPVWTFSKGIFRTSVAERQGAHGNEQNIKILRFSIKHWDSSFELLMTLCRLILLVLISGPLLAQLIQMHSGSHSTAGGLDWTTLFAW